MKLNRIEKWSSVLIVLTFLSICFFALAYTDEPSGLEGLAGWAIMVLFTFSLVVISSLTGVIIGIILLRKGSKKVGATGLSINSIILLFFVISFIWIEHKNRTGIQKHELLMQTMRGDREAFDTLIDKGFDINQKKGHRNYSLLHRAVEQRNIVLLQLLLEKGVDVNSRSSSGSTPLDLLLHNSCNGFHHRKKWDYVKAAKLLLAHGAELDPTKKDGRRHTILQKAVMKNKIGLARLMIEHGADVHISYNGDSLLYYSIGENRHDMVLLLLENGVDVDTKNRNGSTPLSLAAQKARKEIVKTLLEHGADIYNANNSGIAPIHRAAQQLPYDCFCEIFDKYAKADWKEDSLLLVSASGNKDKNVYSYLLEKGAPINATNKYGCTTLHNFAKNGHEYLAKMALDGGADVNHRKQGNETPLHYAVEKGHLAIVKLLVQSGADLNMRGFRNRTPLGIAMGRQNKDIAEYLLDQQDKHGGDKSHKTALELAVSSGRIDSIQLVLARGVDINEKNRYGRTALHYACYKQDGRPPRHTWRVGQKKVVKFLLEKGAHVNAKDKAQQTPLHLAASRWAVEVAEILIEHGAEINAQDIQGKTPLQIIYTQSISKKNDAKKEKLISLLKSHSRIDMGKNNIQSDVSTPITPNTKD